MNMQNKGRYLCWMARVGAIALAQCGAPAIAQHAGGHAAAGAGGAHQHLDGRFSHNQYYFDHGYSVHRLPAASAGFMVEMAAATDSTAVTGTAGAAVPGLSGAHRSACSYPSCRCTSRLCGATAFPITTQTTRTTLG